MVILLFILLFINPLIAESKASRAIESIFQEGVVADLREPSYEDGVLKTTKGGVIVGPNIRIQARNITYTKKMVDDEPVFTIEAEKDLMVEYSDKVFVGEKIFYDFQTMEGAVYDGRTAVVPWYFGGKKFEFHNDGGYTIHNGFITTSENYDSDWQIQAEKVRLFKSDLMRAKNVQFRFINLPLLWVPSYKANVKKIINAPLKYRLRFGGSRGVIFGVVYNLYSWKEWRFDLRADYSIKRGLGGGLETDFESVDKIQRFTTKNYVANDKSIADPDRKTRYRFTGLYYDKFYQDKYSVNLKYDKVSDIDMPSDYYDKGIDTRDVERSELIVRRQKTNAITGSKSRIRLNRFQTVRQELPNIFATLKPFSFGNLVMSNHLDAGLIEYKYSDQIPTTADYHSARLKYQTKLYQNFYLRGVSLTPEVHLHTLLYSNSPEAREEAQIAATLQTLLSTNFYRLYSNKRHNIHPYAEYNYKRASALPSTETYVFDLQDGHHDMHYMRLGVKNTVYKKAQRSLFPLLSFDLYSYTFFDNKENLGKKTPKIYGLLDLYPYANLRTTISTAWDLVREEASYLNTRIGWTFNDNLAASIEYRHRNGYAWRKVDPNNYTMENFHSESTLFPSAISDQRDTLISHIYYRISPRNALELRIRKGWDRISEPDYQEHQLDWHTQLKGSVGLRVSYQHRRDDDRVVLSLSMGQKKPHEKAPLFEMAEGNY